MNKQQQRTNGATNLDAQTEQMRLQVVQLELRARYWKAQYEIKEYMLRDKELKPDYEEYMAQIMKDEQEKLDELKKHIAENQDQGLSMEPIQPEGELVHESEEQTQ